MKVIYKNKNEYFEIKQYVWPGMETERYIKEEMGEGN
jgi:hypothetical protein